ncbi:AgmX/PglI C-terminal domain-containing protein [Polyangium jinanense]|uniref:AgmX/PglI C-terminal domain-containing protein n=1 Tax=Polyangium jinanense TaxID=2829994 RepID=A0A9X3XBI1_9BACT|nr:AgmX/PglI C-terminal domain-containing protein [Polyangium jinanense]MDC3957508.1 AgmX/PglI C-terminal domain-containing protein [Polyangium jinanense]MDC3985001.1 AgmX/PglI C-terminal domain-containing protein [Polyangium jinanense]
MHNQARVAALAAAAWLVGGCANSAARSTGPEPVVMVGDGVKAKPADKPIQTATGDKAAVLEKDPAEPAEYGIIGVLQGADSNKGLGSIFGSEGGVVGGVVGGPVGVYGGLGLSGVGIGGGGTGEGIGLGTLGTVGHGSGYGHGSGFGYGSSRPHERVKARIEAATITGPLTDEVVQRILVDHRDDVQDCYLLESKRGAHVRGRMTLSFTIDGAGRVDEVWVPESSFWSRELTSCVAQVVGTFRFPAPPAQVKVLVPVVF